MPVSPNRPWRRACLALACSAALILVGGLPAVAQTEPSAAPTSPASDAFESLWQKNSNQPDLAWRDPTSHTRVICVTTGVDSAQLGYFHQNVFTADGDLMLFSARHGGDQGYYTFNLRTGDVRQISHQGGANMVVLPHRRAAAFRRGDDVFLMNLDTGDVRKIVTVPHDLLAEAAGFGFTADESRLLFCQCDQLAAETAQTIAATPQKDIHVRRVDFVAAYEKMPKHNVLYTIDIDSGKLTPVFKDEESNWLGHVQGSPTNPNLAIFIHEGFVSVHIKNRLRVLDLTTGQVTMPRTGALEQDGITHEFWDRDGESVWYDISTAGALTHLDLKTGTETRYYYRGGASGRANRSIHYAIGPNGRWAVGDGWQGDNTWLSLYQLSQRDPKTQTVPIVRLCDFSAHYGNLNSHYLEPNPHLTPDGRWVLFTAHLKGNNNQLYAVEIPAIAGAAN